MVACRERPLGWRRHAFFGMSGIDCAARAGLVYPRSDATGCTDRRPQKPMSAPPTKAGATGQQAGLTERGSKLPHSIEAGRTWKGSRTRDQSLHSEAENRPWKILRTPLPQPKTLIPMSKMAGAARRPRGSQSKIPNPKWEAPLRQDSGASGGRPRQPGESACGSQGKSLPAYGEAPGRQPCQSG